LISSPALEVDSRFVYLGSPAGPCDYDETECWGHPGTYIDQLTVMFPMNHTVNVIAGPHNRGLLVFVDGKAAESNYRQTFSLPQAASALQQKLAMVSEDAVTVIRTKNNTVSIRTSWLIINVVNSDGFMNVHTQLTNSALIELGSKQVDSLADCVQIPLTGLLGQSWCNFEIDQNSYRDFHLDSTGTHPSSLYQF